MARNYWNIRSSDLNGGLIFSRTKKALVGIRYSANVPVTTWFDEDLARLQAALDKALPERTNAIDIADENSRYVLIYSASDTNPGGYFLYDTEKRSLQEVSKSREWLPPTLMSKRSFMKYKARDGREIPAWVITPIDRDGKNLPLVVHIHGGPWVRGYSGIQWGRWPVAQFLASRGYAVLEPEPRGSTGFGRSHYTASFKQWGLAMQDDISDGALYLVKEGIGTRAACVSSAEAMVATRRCRVWSRSGFVALRCCLCGRTDLELKQTVSWSDTARLTDYYETDFKRWVGDKRIAIASNSRKRRRQKMRTRSRRRCYWRWVATTSAFRSFTERRCAMRWKKRASRSNMWSMTAKRMASIKNRASSISIRG
ncbi:MAG: prolyl oligopeptidase family serine peptidase [Betaproteobacteria bacterium]|nr:prolyl oligopeptidase family serine peptidase [Betaproteobacteria bacterium]